MGKITVALAVLLAVPAAAAAQDFGTEWLDRVIRERQQERGPLKPAPVEWTGSAGILAFLDNNIFLADKDGKTPGDLVVVPFVQGRMEYSEQRFEAVADVLLNYKGYADLNHDPSIDLQSARDYEQRFYGHARYLDARFTVGVDEILRHESDPVNVIFTNRAERVVSNTMAHATYDLTRTFAAEGHLDYQVVRFEKQPFAALANNDSYRADVSLVYRQANGYDWLVQAGYTSIYYTRSQTGGAPPDSDGYYARAGFRGALTERLSIEALAGWITLKSDRYVGTPNREDQSTADIAASVRYEATDAIRVNLDLNRTMGFAGAGDPFQTVTRFLAGLEWDATPEITIRARWQWDHAASIRGILREYQSYGLTGTYRLSEQFSIDGGGTWRTGNTHGAASTATEFENAIGHIGVVFSF